MALARTNTQILRSDGGSATVAVNSPLTGNGSQQLPLGLDENYHGADGESLTFNITDIENGHQVTISGIQGSSSFDVLNGQDGANGVNGVNGADGQSVTFDIANITNGHRVTLSGAQGSASFDVLNGQDGVDGVSPTFRFVENEDGVTVIVSGAQGEDSFTLYNATGEGGATYSAGSFIDIYDVDGQKYISANVSAGTPWLSGWKEIGALSLNFGDSVQIVSSHDFSGFHNHAIGLKGAVVTLPSTAHIGSALDDKLDASSFNTFISNEYSTAKSDIYNSASYLMQNKLDTSASANFYPMTGNPSGFLTAHQSITNLPYVQNSALNYTPSTFISGISGHELYAESANHAFTAETANYVEGGWEYSDNKITAYNGSAFSAGSTYDVTAGANINVSTAGNTFGISGKDWTDTITAASAYAASQAQGKTYTGVAPIVVNNNEDKISANCIELSAGNGIDSNLLATGVIEVSSQGGSNFTVTDGTSSYSAIGFYDQTNDHGCYQIMGTANNGPTLPGQSFGYTLPTQSRTFSSDCVESAKNYTNSAISAHIMYVNYGALTAGTVTFADIKTCINNGGIVIPYEIKLPGNNYKIYNYEISGIADNTTAYTFGRFEAAGKHQYMVISSYNAGATTGCITADEKLYATPHDVELVDRIVLVATSGNIPASGASDNKVYIVTGNS